MKRKNKSNFTRPTIDQLKNEIVRIKRQKSILRSCRAVFSTLIVVAATAIVVSAIWISMFLVYGSSMEPTLNNNEILVTLKGESFEYGDIVAFYFNNKVLIKRVIAVGGDVVDFDDSGNVYVNDKRLEERYLDSRQMGDVDIEFPHVVPNDKVFVLGDNRATSVDSRHTEIGDLSEEMIIGVVKLRIWPLNKIGVIE